MYNYEHINKLIGARLRNARTMSGLSQQQLGDKLGITFQQVQKYEKGSNSISAAKLIRIADILGVTLDHFYDTPKAASPATLRRKFLHVIQNLQRIDQHSPAAFIGICNMVAALVPAIMKEE